MRLARVLYRGDYRLAAVLDDTVALLPERLGTLDDIVRSGPSAVDAVRAATHNAPTLPFDRVRFAAPFTRFNRDILCTGWNYWDHHGDNARPEHPTFFTKGPDTVIGPHDDIAYDPIISGCWDYEAEIALVIGRQGRSIREESALDHIFGYFVANDVSVRDLQCAHGGQWLKGKSIDATMPVGPWVTTPDEIPDLREMRVRCEVNGAILQDASTASMAFPFARLITELSFGMTLRPGDILLTGTPGGIGNARDPQIFLRDGDVVTTSVTGLGTLRNRVGLRTGVFVR